MIIIKNIKNSLRNLIILLIKNVWRLFQNLNIYICYHRGTNITTYYSEKMGNCISDSNILMTDFSRNIENKKKKTVFED